MEPRKMVLMILCTEEQKRHRCKEQTLDSVDEGEDGMIWENKIETYILPYVSASWTYEAPRTGALWQPGGDRVGGERGGEFRMEGTHVYQWPIHIDVWQKPWQCYKVIILQVKLINF